jgi:hypothetical protein
MTFDSSRGRASQLRGNDGTEIAEAAFVFPILFLLLMAIFWFGRAFSVYGTINHAARVGASTAAIPACANCTGGVTWSGTSLPSDTTVVDAVNATLNAAHVDPTGASPLLPTPAPPSCPTTIVPGSCTNATGTSPSGTITICRNVVLDQNSGAPGVCGVIVSFEYPYQQVLPLIYKGSQQIFLKAQVSMKAED